MLFGLVKMNRIVKWTYKTELITCKIKLITIKNEIKHMC